MQMLRAGYVLYRALVYFVIIFVVSYFYCLFSKLSQLVKFSYVTKNIFS